MICHCIVFLIYVTCMNSGVNARREERVIMISFVYLSVCALFCPYNPKTITSIDLKFGGHMFHVIQTDSSKSGKI